MKRKRGTIIIMLLGFIAVFTYCLAPKEPSYQGKRLTYWLKEINRSVGPEGAKTGTEAIRAMGPKALPCLLRYIEAKESPLYAKLRQFVQKQKFTQFLLAEPASFRTASIFVLIHLGQEAEPVLSRIRFYEGSAGESHGEEALQFAGPLGSNLLVRACQSTNKNVRIKAALMFVKATEQAVDRGTWIWNTPIGLTTSTTIGTNDMQALGRNLHHENSGVRQASEDVLWHWIAILGESRLRDAAIEALKEIDPDVARKTAWE